MSVASASGTAASRHLAPRASLILLTTTLIAFLAASSVPTPLYAVYQEAWGFSSTMLTIVYASYALALLAALITVGSLSDHIGRRPVIVGALIVEGAAMLTFLNAQSVAWLVVARVVQGFATGAATSALGAAVFDVDRKNGTVINGVAPICGTAVGVLTSGLLVQFAPFPTHLVFAVFLAAFITQLVLVFFVPDGATRQPGALRSLIPQVHVPRPARAAFLRVSMLIVAIWALGGFYLSLGPALAHAITGLSGAMVGGFIPLCFCTTAAISVYTMRDGETHRMMVIACSSLLVGLLITLAGVHALSDVLFFGGTLVAGVGFGCGFMAALRSLLPYAAAHERAGMLAALYVLSYLAFCIPAVGAGLLTHHIGIVPTMNWYGGAMTVLAALSLLATLMERRIPTLPAA